VRLKERFHRNGDETSQKLIKRKVLWKHNIIPTNPVNLDSKAANRKIARDKNVSANSASGKDKAVVANEVVAANLVEVNRAAVVSKGDDKPGRLGIKVAGGDSRRFSYSRTLHGE